MRRRRSPYSQITTLRRSREELVTLGLVTVALGLLLNLIASALYQIVCPQPEPSSTQWLVLVVALLLTLVLVLVIAWRFYHRTESQHVPIEIWLSYHWPASARPGVAQRRSYQVTIYARQAFAHRYPKNAPQTKAFATAWSEALAQNVPFQRFIAPVNAQLIQYLLLCVLHRYGDDSLGPEAACGWWRVDLPARQLTMDDLPIPLRDNPFLRADQRPEAWRLWWPQQVEIRSETDDEGGWSWQLVHDRFGRVEIQAYPQLLVAGRESQPMRVFLQRLKLQRGSQLYVVGTRLEAAARFRWTFLPASEPFHDWATNLLSYLEEALDWGHFLANRPARLITDLDWKMGWVPEGTSLFDKLQEIEGRLERWLALSCFRRHERLGDLQHLLLGQVGKHFDLDIADVPDQPLAVVVGVSGKAKAGRGLRWRRAFRFHDDVTNRGGKLELPLEAGDQDAPLTVDAHLLAGGQGFIGQSSALDYLDEPFLASVGLP